MRLTDRRTRRIPSGLDISATPNADAFYFDEWVKSVPNLLAKAKKLAADDKKKLEQVEKQYDDVAKNDPELARKLVLPLLNRAKKRNAAFAKEIALYQAASQPSKAFVENLKKLSKIPNLTLQVYYVDEKPDVLAFAKDVASKGGNSVNLFFGHGIGSLVSGEGVVNREVVTQVKEALRNLPGTGANRPRIGFYSCFGGLYNDAGPRPTESPHLSTLRPP